MNNLVYWCLFHNIEFYLFASVGDSNPDVCHAENFVTFVVIN